MLLVVVCVRLLIDTMLSLKKLSFVAFVAWLLIYCCLFTSVVCIRPALAMKKGRRTDHWEHEWDNEKIIVANS